MLSVWKSGYDRAKRKVYYFDVESGERRFELPKIGYRVIKKTRYRSVDNPERLLSGKPRDGELVFKYSSSEWINVRSKEKISKKPSSGWIMEHYEVYENLQTATQITEDDLNKLKKRRESSTKDSVPLVDGDKIASVEDWALTTPREARCFLSFLCSCKAKDEKGVLSAFTEECRNALKRQPSFLPSVFESVASNWKELHEGTFVRTSHECTVEATLKDGRRAVIAYAAVLASDGKIRGLTALAPVERRIVTKKIPSEGNDSKLQNAVLSLAKITGGGCAGAALRMNRTGDTFVQRAVAGYRQICPDERATSSCEVDDRFHFGSVTKMLTATLAGVLVDRGAITWDDTVTKILGDCGVKSDATLMHLLQHISGLKPLSPTCNKWQRDMISLMGRLDRIGHTSRDLRGKRLEFLREYTKRPADHAPGTYCAYSNVNFLIIASMLEAVTDMSYERLCSDLIFKPLAMTTAGFGPPGRNEPNAAIRRKKFVWPHTADGTPIDPVDFKADNARLLNSAGRLHCSVTDMVEGLLRVHIDSEHAKKIALTQKTIERMHSLNKSVDAGTLAPGYDNVVGRSRHPACGWFNSEAAWYPRESGLGHEGSNRLNVAAVRILPRERIALVLASNIQFKGGSGPIEGFFESIGKPLLAL